VNLKQAVTAVLVFFIARTAAFSQNTAFPRLQPDPKALEYYRLGEKGPYSWTDLARISLWASGDTSDSNFEKIRVAAEKLKDSPDLPDTDRERAEYVLKFMYKNILKSYSLYQTKVDVMLSTGSYNCVSSAVLYMILCKSLGINTNGVITKDHSFITIPAGGGAPAGAAGIDVETTNAHGFDPGNRKEFHDQFGKVTGFSYVPAKNYRDRQTVSPVELVSVIMVNIIAGYERQNRFFDSVPVAIDRAALLAGNALAAAPAPPAGPAPEQRGTLFSDPRKDLTDRLFNFGAALLKAGKEEEGLQWAAAASPVYPDEKRWHEFIIAAINNRMAKLIRANKYGDAEKFIEGQRPVLSREDFEKFDALLAGAELIDMANKIRAAEDGDNVLNAVEQARNSGRVPEKRAVEIITLAVQKTVSSLGAAKNWRAAIQYAEAAIVRFGANGELERILNVYRGNLAADFHNRFAAEWNKKNYAEAERVLNEGLDEFPDNRQLLADKQTVIRLSK